MTTLFQMVCRNGTPYEFKPSDKLMCKIVSTSGQVANIPHVVEPTPLNGQHTFKVSFTTKVAGRYIINIKINNKPLGGGEIHRKYLPGMGVGWGRRGGCGIYVRVTSWCNVRLHVACMQS